MRKKRNGRSLGINNHRSHQCVTHSKPSNLPGGGGFLVPAHLRSGLGQSGGLFRPGCGVLQRNVCASQTINLWQRVFVYFVVVAGEREVRGRGQGSEVRKK